MRMLRMWGKLIGNNTLSKHKRLHTVERKPYEYSECEKKVTIKNALTGHERIHTEEKPCKCL